MVRTIDLPDLGAVSDTSRIVADKAGSGSFSASALKSYCVGTTPSEAPSDGKTYGRLNAAWAQVLPISGGAITGTLSVAGAVTFSGTLGVTGAATFAGTLNATGAIATTSALFGETLRISSVNTYEWAHFVAANGDHYQQHRPGWNDTWAASSGQRQWTSPSGNLMTLDGSGNLVLSATCAATQFWSGGVGIFGFLPAGSGRIFQFAPGFYLDYSTTNVPVGTGGQLAWTVSNGPLWVMRASDDFCFNPQSAVGGNGAYINSSDRRMKTGITPTSKGLAEVLQLQPVSFTRADPTTGAQEEIGFVAQDVQPILPEAVWTAGIPLRDGTGGLDSAEPTLGLSGETITAINVNAIKELNALIASLTDRIAALEAAP
jgi:hypothetical protein